MIAIVTNIDADHMSTYGGDFERLNKRLYSFAESPFYGLVIAMLDDVVTELLPMLVDFSDIGIESDADYRAIDITTDGLTTHFEVVRPDDNNLK